MQTTRNECNQLKWLSVHSHAYMRLNVMFGWDWTGIGIGIATETGWERKGNKNELNWKNQIENGNVYRNSETQGKANHIMEFIPFPVGGT